MSHPEDAYWDRKLRDLPGRWNENDGEAARAFWSWLAEHRWLTPNAGALARRHAAPLRVRVERLVEDAGCLVIGQLDNAVNRGDRDGLVYSTYATAGPVDWDRPPGRDDEPLRLKAVERAIERKYRWPRICCGVHTFDLRVPSRVRDLARVLMSGTLRRAGQNALRERAVPAVSLDALPADGGWSRAAVEEESMGTTLAGLPPERLAETFRGAESALDALVAGSARGACPWRFFAVTRAFLAWTAAGCAAPAEHPPFSAWLAAELGLDAPAGETERDRCAALNGAVTDAHWRRLADAPPAVPAADAAVEGWRALMARVEPSLYAAWRDAAAELRAGAGSNSVEQAKRRADERRALVPFYLAIGALPEDHGAGGSGDLRAAWRRFLEGDVAPEEAAAMRARLDADPLLFWAFSDYVDDLQAWGCRPQPAVALLRERLRAWTHARLNLKLGSLPAAPEELIAAALETAARLRGAAPSPRPVSAQVLGAPPAFAGFGLEPGSDVRLDALEQDGRESGSDPASARVLAAGVDAAARSASVTLRCPEGTPDGAVIAAQAVIRGDHRYSLAAEVIAGEARVTVDELPEEVGPLVIERWLLIPPPAGEQPADA